jgi:hypothetical protein
MKHIKLFEDINWEDWNEEENDNNLLEIYNNQDQKNPFTFELRKEDYDKFKLYCKEYKINIRFSYSSFHFNNINKIYVYLYTKQSDYGFYTKYYMSYMPYNEEGDRYNINNNRISYGEIRFENN